MGKVREWIRLIIAAGICLLFLLSGKELSTGDCEEKIVRYVALGDSIAGGYGLKDVQNDSYVSAGAEKTGIGSAKECMRGISGKMD